MTNLAEEKFDHAIRGKISIEPNHVTLKLGESPFIMATSPEYIATREAAVRPEELAHHGCLHFSRLHWRRLRHSKKDEEKLRIPIVPRIECIDGRGLAAEAIGGANSFL